MMIGLGGPMKYACCKECGLEKWYYVRGPHATQKARDWFRKEGWKITGRKALCPKCKENGHETT